ncbi:MAG: SAM-dependent methyltransferase, partial [Haloplanus sp.]
MEHADRRYLEAKRTVDDRALDRRVRDRFLDELPGAPRIREAGVGTGVTVPRLLDWGITAGDYLGVDRGAEVIEYARDRR